MFTISQISIREHYAAVSELMRMLHVSEKSLFDGTADWKDIGQHYMRHAIAMQEEQDGICLLASGQANAIGFLFGYMEYPDDSRFETYEGPGLYVSDGYVVPEYRRKGLYRQMNDMLEAAFIQKGVRRIIRFTLRNNGNMRQFLEKQGYLATRLQYEKWLSPDGTAVRNPAIRPLP